MGHGEASLQADALVHQELPKQPRGATRGVPGGSRRRGRGRRRWALHRQDSLEAGDSAGGAGTFLDSLGGGAGGEGAEDALAPPHCWTALGGPHQDGWGN